jgi:hypothetical protein
MAPTYAPLTINRDLAVSLRGIQTTSIRDEAARQALGVLLQSALQLEFATIPPYLAAAFSLTANRKIYQLILRVAVEEMLHMTAVANLMNAIGIAPNVVAAVPNYPYDLTVLDPPLRLDLRSFSFDLVEKLFMSIEAPEERVEFPAALVEVRPRTIGQFYAGIIEIIERDTIPDLFKNAVRDAYKQRTVTPIFGPIAYINNQDTHTYPLKADIDFSITDSASAVQHLSWVVDQGEGEAHYDPLATEGLPGHHYRFESILMANRKLNVWSAGATPVVEAQASATAGETKRLEGDNPWRQGRHASEVLRLASAIPRPQARAIRAAMFRSTGMRCHQSSR